MHHGGQMADAAGVASWLHRFGLKVIEEAALLPRFLSRRCFRTVEIGRNQRGCQLLLVLREQDDHDR
jgi:hypothetical protein